MSNGTTTANGRPAKRQKNETNGGSDETAMSVQAANYDVSNLYLESVDRSKLDFDFEKLCSVTLSNLNVYACLVCGKYFQGRGKSSPAYFHSLDGDHHVYINLSSSRIYVLPESYEVQSLALKDIKHVIHPSYTKEQVALLDSSDKTEFDLQRKPYVPGFIGLNNINQNDYVNAVIQALSHVIPLRNFFLLENLEGKPELLHRVGTIVRKIWNDKSFRGHVSPHELLQQLVKQSNKQFKLTEQGDPLELLTWLMNSMHTELGGSRSKSHSSIVQKVFQGRVRVESQQITAGTTSRSGRRLFEADTNIDTKDAPFLFLSLDLPPAPLFPDEIDANFIPQIALTTLLAKYDGSTVQELAGQRKRYKILQLPPYLIFAYKRFANNDFKDEKNPTIITFPIRDLDMGPYTEASREGVSALYDLCANITHQTIPSAGGEKHAFKVHLHNRAKDEWLQIQDLQIDRIEKQMIFLGESYIQIWERKRRRHT